VQDPGATRAQAAPIRVLIADDHPIYIDGLAAAIKRTQDLELVAACRDGAEALERIRAERPDVAVLDLRMPRLETTRILEELGAANEAGTRVLVLSVHVGAGEVHECVSLGAAGYLAKDTDRAEICDAASRRFAAATSQGAAHLPGRRRRAPVHGQAPR
jgi:two-component system, NarL family, nitrate/nitrite response regulator NarL